MRDYVFTPPHFHLQTRCFTGHMENNVEPDPLLLRSHLILIYTVFKTGYIWPQRSKG